MSEVKTKGLGSFQTETEATEIIHLMYMLHLDNYFFKQGKDKELIDDYSKAMEEYFHVKRNFKGDIVKDKAWKTHSKTVELFANDLKVMGNRLSSVTKLWDANLKDKNFTYKVMAQGFYNPIMQFSNLIMLLGPEDFWEYIKRKKDLSMKELLEEMSISAQRLTNSNTHEENKTLNIKIEDEI